MEILRWSRAEAQTAVGSPALDRDLGTAVGVPAVVVDLGDDPGADLAAAIATLPVVAIGVGSAPAPGWDIHTLDPGAVIDGVEASPQAAVTTAQVLRGHADRTVDEGLLIESLAYATLQGGPEFTRWLESQGQRVRNDNEPRVRMNALDDVTEIVLSRARLHNLLDARMRDELVEALRTVGAGSGGQIRLSGDGPSFCAGGDPAEFGTVSDAPTGHLLRATANIAPHLHRLAHRTSAHVHGNCVGAGVELAAFCGRVVAHPQTRFKLPETRMGLLPGAGGTVSIPARIGRHRTLEWLLSDRELDASTALEWGLVDTLSPTSDS